jgi:hypothetical protein
MDSLGVSLSRQGRNVGGRSNPFPERWRGLIRHRKHARPSKAGGRPLVARFSPMSPQQRRSAGKPCREAMRGNRTRFDGPLGPTSQPGRTAIPAPPDTERGRSVESVESHDAPRFAWDGVGLLLAVGYCFRFILRAAVGVAVGVSFQFVGGVERSAVRGLLTRHQLRGDPSRAGVSPPSSRCQPSEPGSGFTKSAHIASRIGWIAAWTSANDSPIVARSFVFAR